MDRDEVPSTEDAAARVIGRLEIHSRSVRGFKAETGIEAVFQLRGATMRS